MLSSLKVHIKSNVDVHSYNTLGPNINFFKARIFFKVCCHIADLYVMFNEIEQTLDLRTILHLYL